MNTQTPTPRTDRLMFEEACNFDVAWDEEYLKLELELVEKDAQITNLEQQRDCASDLLAKAEARMLEKDAQIAELNQRLIDRRESFQTQLVRIESTWREKLCEAQAQIVALRDALGAYAEFHGGCEHHPDDCPLEEDECRICHALNKAFSTPPPPVVPLEDVKPLVEALRAISKQKLSKELDTDEHQSADFEYGYDSCVEQSREALTTSTTKHPIN
jgi:hypothetical protein